jgi:hypothetical protein
MQLASSVGTKLYDVTGLKQLGEDITYLKDSTKSLVTGEAPVKLELPSACDEGYNIEVEDSGKGQPKLRCTKEKSESWGGYASSFVWEDNAKKMKQLDDIVSNIITDASEVYTSLKCIRIILTATWNILVSSGVSLNKQPGLKNATEKLLMSSSYFCKSIAACMDVWDFIRESNGSTVATKVDTIVMGCWSIRKTVRALKNNVLQDALAFDVSLNNYSNKYSTSWNKLIDDKDEIIDENMTSFKNELIVELIEWIKDKEQVAYNTIVIYAPIHLMYISPPKEKQSTCEFALSMICVLNRNAMFLQLASQHMLKELEDNNKNEGFDANLKNLSDRTPKYMNHTTYDILQLCNIALSRFKDAQKACHVNVSDISKDRELEKLLEKFASIHGNPEWSPSMTFDKIQKHIERLNNESSKVLGIKGRKFVIFYIYEKYCPSIQQLNSG